MNESNPFSPREKEVIDLLLQGKSNKQIAYSLGISERTVEFHLNNSFEKMHVNSRVELILKLGKSTGEKPGKPVESTVDGGERSKHNDRQTDTSTSSDPFLEKPVSVNKRESAMEQKLRTLLPPIVVLMGLALLVGGIVTHKYGAVVIGIIAAGVAAQQWIEAYRNKEEPKS